MNLGLPSLLAISLGGVIGSGWMIAAGKTAGQAPGNAAYLAWAVGALAIAVIGAVMVRTATSARRPGGMVAWPMASSGGLVASFVAAGLWVYYAANPPAQAIAIVKALADRSDWADPLIKAGPEPGDLFLTLPGVLVAALLMAVFAAVSFVSFTLFVRLSIALTTFKVLVPALTIATLAVSSGTFAPDRTISGSDHWWLGFQAVVTGGAIFAYTGFQAPLDHTEDARADRNIGRAVMITIAVSIVLYVGLQYVYTKHADPDATERWSSFTKLAQAGSHGWLVALLVVASILSPLGSALIFNVALREEVTQLPHQDLAPDWLSRPDRRRPIFLNAVLANFAVGLIILLAHYAFDRWDGLVQVSGVLSLFVYAMAAFPLTVLAEQSDEEPLHWIWSRVLAPLSFGLASAIIFLTSTAVVVVSVGLIGSVGLVIYRYRWGRVLRQQRERELRAGFWIAPFLLLLATLTLPFSDDDNVRGSEIALRAALGLALGLIAYLIGIRAARHYVRQSAPVGP